MSDRQAIEESLESLLQACADYQGKLPSELTVGVLGSAQAVVRVRYGANEVPLEYVQALPEVTPGV